MVADHPKHMISVLRVTREGSQFASDFRRSGIGRAGHDRGQRGANRPAFIAVIGMTRRHQQPADIRVTKAKGAVIIGQLGNFFGWELRHQDRNFQGQGPEAASMLIGFNIEGLIGVAELHQV